jgi:hypothetical protein
MGVTLTIDGVPILVKLVAGLMASGRRYEFVILSVT